MIIVGLMDPNYIQGNSKNVKPDHGAMFNNFARMFFVDSPGKTPTTLQASSWASPPAAAAARRGGTLVKVLQLIQ